ncbi:MAG TPA: 4'-phosphopantetheinyl transferase superfamily protein [Vicinamibacteria bacterium]|nr:4'-phosphopantetheinyl transferase superfamily protein [Vicinamibacteria bacterium]
MVVGLGIDIVEIDRVRAALDRWGDRLVARLMDADEAARLPEAPADRARAVALAIAGKEAASKALGTGWTRGVRWRDVAIRAEPATAELRAGARAWAERLGSTGRGALRFQERGNLVVAEYRLLG